MLVSWLFATEQLRQGHVGKVGLVHKRARAGVPGLLGGGDLTIDRGQNDPWMPGQRGELAREHDSIPVGQLDVNQDRRRLQGNGSHQRLSDAAGPADDRQPASGGSTFRAAA